MNQSQAVDYLWEQNFFEEWRTPKEISDKIWELFKIHCSNISMILKTKKYLIVKRNVGWRQRFGPEKNTETEGIHAVYIEAKKPVTAIQKVEEVLEKLSGEILICDNYFGLKSMVNLYKMKKASNIKFICGNVKNDEQEMKNLVADYNKEKHLEVKVFDKAQLHDRYIITDDYFIILGHGFADLGNRESLVLLLPNSFVKDISEDLRNRFVQKWNGAKSL